MNIHLRFSKHSWQYPILVALHKKVRSRRPEVFCKKSCFWKFQKQRKLFSCEFCEIFKYTFFHRTPPVAASEKLKAKAVTRRCSVKKVFLEILLNSQENTCARVSFLQPLTQTFSCEFCEHFSTNRMHPVVAPVKACNFTKIRLRHGCFLWTF